MYASTLINALQNLKITHKGGTDIFVLNTIIRIKRRRHVYFPHSSERLMVMKVLIFKIFTTMATFLVRNILIYIKHELFRLLSAEGMETFKIMR